MRSCFTLFCLTAHLLFHPAFSYAAELLVSPNSAYKTIAQAIAKAQPGDVIKLSPSDSPYYESAVFRNKAATKDKPLVLDGQGAVLDGSDPLLASEWTQIAPQLYKSTAFPERLRLNKSVLGRYFFLFDGKINRMGGMSKAKAALMKAPADLHANEWTYIETEKAFYLKLDENTALSSVRAPFRSSGVALSGNCSNIIIRNITVTHVWNDGFNIHDHCYDISFENIRAIECGDDGISAHEDSTIAVNGMLSRGNATGFCHIGESKSDTANIVIENCGAYGVYLLDNSRHQLRNCIIRGKSTFALRLLRGTTLDADNVLIENSGTVQIASGATLDATRFTSWNSNWEMDGASVAIEHSLLGGNDAAVTLANASRWKSDRNIWSVRAIIWNGKTYDKSTFANYVNDSGQDKNSSFEVVESRQLYTNELAPVGIDFAQLPK